MIRFCDSLFLLCLSKLSHNKDFQFHLPLCTYFSTDSEDISDVTSTVTQHLWIKTEEMTEIRVFQTTVAPLTYMLDFILKRGGKLEYQESASMSKCKENARIDTCRKSRWKFVCEQRIWPARKSFCQWHAPLILRTWTKMSSMFTNRYLRYSLQV